VREGGAQGRRRELFSKDTGGGGSLLAVKAITRDLTKLQDMGLDASLLASWARTSSYLLALFLSPPLSCFLLCSRFMFWVEADKS
jgi:hypothetical protein